MPADTHPFDHNRPRECFACGRNQLISLMSWFPAHKGYVVAMCDDCLDHGGVYVR